MVVCAEQTLQSLTNSVFGFFSPYPGTVLYLTSKNQPHFGYPFKLGAHWQLGLPRSREETHKPFAAQSSRVPNCSLTESNLEREIVSY